MNQYLQFPNFDPVAFSIGPISLHWYGAMYLFGVLGALYLAKRRARKSSFLGIFRAIYWGTIRLRFIL